MNFREELIRRIIQLLENNLVLGDPSQVVAAAQGTQVITPNTNYTGVLRSIGPGAVATTGAGPLEELPVPVADSANAPIAFVSFDGGRHDLGLDTFLSHIVETIGIRIEILLSRKIGINDPEGPENIRPITFQASDLLHDITSLINKTSLQSALNILEDVTINDLVLEEWEFDDRFRGGPEEVLIMIFRAEIADTRQ